MKKRVREIEEKRKSTVKKGNYRSIQGKALTGGVKALIHGE